MSAEYGWTTEYIWTLTLREIDWRLRVIMDRKNSDMKFEATLHDKKISTPMHSKAKKDKTTIEISEKQKLSIENAFNQKFKKAEG